MVVRFLMDNVQRENDEILERINRLATKEPYPDKHTAHLSVFLKACFDIELEKTLVVLRRKEEAEAIIRNKRLAEIRRKEEERKIKELESMAPSAPAPPQGLPPLEIETIGKKEYSIMLYSSPVGVLVDQDEQGRYSYRKHEPVLDLKIIDFIEQNFGDIVGKDMSILDKNEFIQLSAFKAAKKLNLKLGVEDLGKVRYYLKRDALGAGLIDVLIVDEKVKEIIIEGSEPITISYSVHGMLGTNINFETNEKLNNLIFRIASVTGQNINEQQPMMSVQFQGFAISATLGIGGSSSRMVLKRL